MPMILVTSITAYDVDDGGGDNHHGVDVAIEQQRFQTQRGEVVSVASVAAATSFQTTHKPKTE